MDGATRTKLPKLGPGSHRSLPLHAFVHGETSFTDLRGQREHQVDVQHRQDPLGHGRNPVLLGQGLAFRAVPVPATAIGLFLPSARGAGVSIATHEGGAAGGDVREGAALQLGQRVPLLQIGPMLSSDFREIKPGPPEGGGPFHASSPSKADPPHLLIRSQYRTDQGFPHLDAQATIQPSPHRYTPLCRAATRVQLQSLGYLL